MRCTLSLALVVLLSITHAQTAKTEPAAVVYCMAPECECFLPCRGMAGLEYEIFRATIAYAFKNEVARSFKKAILKASRIRGRRLNYLPPECLKAAMRDCVNTMRAGRPWEARGAAVLTNRKRQFGGFGGVE